MQWPLSVQPGPSSRLSLGTSRMQLPSFLPVQQPSNDDERSVYSQGSFPSLQDTGSLQNQRFYNQQQPNQVGVHYHSLQYLANPSSPAQVAFYNNITRFNNLTKAQRTQELGLDKTYTPQDFQPLPKTDAPVIKQGSTRYWDGATPNPSIKQRTADVAKAPVKGGQVIFHFLQHIL